MSDEAAPPAEKQVTFNVKSSSDAKYTLTVGDSMTVAQLKEKLSSSDYADVEASRQRLIYSGRVLKDHDPLSAYNIKDGNTVHLVKGAASNQQRNTTSSDSTVPNAGVPQNIAAGTGGDPLAGLTGARYAGFAQLPGADMFGPDGMSAGAGSPERMLEMLENPMFQSQMNEAMNNPQVIQMMQNNPMIRNNPMLRDMLNNPEMRRMMFDPNVIRQSMQFSRMMRGTGAGGAGEAGSMPAPGVTDTTPAGQRGSQNTEQGSQQQGQQGSQQPPNPFAFMGTPGFGSAQAPNPFASLFNPAEFGASTSPPSNTGATAQQPPTGSDQPRDQSNTQSSTGQQQAPPPNPFAGLFGGAGAGSAPGSNDMMQNMYQSMMSNPEMMRQAMQMANSMMGGGQNAGLGGLGGGAAPGGGNDAAGGNAPFNPFAMLGGGGGQGFGAPAPQDTRPPEEQYSEQLRQLNDMGFFDFDRNVRALRMSGGRVEGAVEMLLSGTI